MSEKNQFFKSGKTIRLRWDFWRSQICAGFGDLPSQYKCYAMIQQREHILYQK